MIRVTRLDRQEIVLNCDLVESVESRPDTTIRLVTGASLVVRESLAELLELVREWRASVLSRAGLAALVAQPTAALPALAYRAAGLAADRESESDRAQLEVPA